MAFVDVDAAAKAHASILSTCHDNHLVRGAVRLEDILVAIVGDHCQQVWCSLLVLYRWRVSNDNCKNTFHTLT